MKLELNVKRFNNEDVIATSGQVTYTISGLGDSDRTTFGFTSSDGVYNYTSASELKKSGDPILNKFFLWNIEKNNSTALTDLIQRQAFSEDNNNGQWDNQFVLSNGTYIFDGTKYVKQ